MQDENISDTNGEKILEDTSDTPVLRNYIDMFFQYTTIANKINDGRMLFYRGQSDKSYLLTPSVFRNNLLTKEGRLIQTLLLSSPSDFNGITNDLDKLIKVQHYGLATRLLDVTTNPLVSMYFACADKHDKDGEIFLFFDHMRYPNDIDVRCLAALAEYAGSSERQLVGFLAQKGLDNIDCNRLTLLSYIPIQVPLNNERIKRQQGAFIILGIRTEESENPYQKAVFDLKPILKNPIYENDNGIEMSMPKSIIVPKQEKKQILNELGALGINKAFLFPELEYQAEFIMQKILDGML